MKKQLTYFAVAFLLLSSGCKEDNMQESVYSVDAIKSTKEKNSLVHASQDFVTLLGAKEPVQMHGGLPKEFVCMVNNAYMGKAQFPVEFEGKQYYGCCQMCVKAIQNERRVRVALDPYTGKEVDKSFAFIALKPGSVNGEVFYFESEATFESYKVQN
ncbi:hypothetical protein ACMA1I_08545 [Pontibacter sp. 13R65]|uniref:hypothetical protein n=1 Tax=Pontibacter sp. 13R65 TaxID=3127458 RepID=UPI00301D1298